MMARVEFENIEVMRLEAGIHDVGLREHVAVQISRSCAFKYSTSCLCASAETFK